ncbi:hypothetical protein ACFX1R_028638 [Malus domestica]
MGKQILAESIKLADQVTKALDRAIVSSTAKELIPELKSKTQNLAGLLRQLSICDLSDSFHGSYDVAVRRILISVIERAGVAKHLIQFVYFGERIIQFPALFLMCYITLHVLPDRCEELATVECSSCFTGHLENLILFEINC